MADQYPTPGSLADELYRLTRKELRARYGDPLTQRPSHVPERSRHIDFGSLIGFEHYWVPGQRLFIDVQFPPQASRPAQVGFTFEWRLRAELLMRLETLGLPRPELDPTAVVDNRPESWRSTSYLPGPTGLAELHYTVWRTETPTGGWASVRSVKPKDMQKREEVFDWEGTMYWAQLVTEVSKTKPDRHYPPGDTQMRKLTPP